MAHSLTIKRLAAPMTWKMKRKGITFVTRPLPGAHPYKLGVSLSFLLRDVLNVAETAREARYIINNKEILINCSKQKEHKFLVGFLDSISFTPLNQHYRVVLSTKGTLAAISIDADEAKKKLAKIIGKQAINTGHLQLNLSDGRNILVEKDTYKCGDSLLLEVPEQKIISHFRLEKGVPVMLTDGKHRGKLGIVEEIIKDIIVFRVDKELYRTKREYAFVLGKETPALKIV